MMATIFIVPEQLVGSGLLHSLSTSILYPVGLLMLFAVPFMQRSVVLSSWHVVWDLTQQSIIQVGGGASVRHAMLGGLCTVQQR